MIPLLVSLFVLSGMAGLIYESIWSRYLGLFVGHSAYAQIIVLVIFLGGMSWGALLVARRSSQVRTPLLAYALVEAVVGALGLLFHPGYLVATTFAYDAWFPSLAGAPWLHVAKWTLAGALILPQSVLLGATFPLMSAGIIRRVPKAPGRMLALLYFANSLGAAVGALVSGFFLVGALGLPGTVAAAAVVNLVVAATVALALHAERRATAEARGPRAAHPSSAGRSAPGPPPGSAPPDLTRLLLAVSFGTAVASFIYEIAWIRMLSLVLGSTARSFEVMLSVFILGLALGALWVRSHADRFRAPLEVLGILQWAMGSLALATLPLYLGSFYWMSDALLNFPHTDRGYQVFTLVRYAICLAVMLPATFCAGTTLPLLSRALMASGVGERAIGLVYGVNTLGSILGAAVAGLVLMPALGLKGLLITGAMVDVTLGVALLAFYGRESARARRLGRLATGLTVLLVTVVAAFVPFDRHLLTSGVYRSGMLADKRTIHIVSYHDGRTASISVERYDVSQSQTLSTNGKGDASLRLLWLEPLAQRPPTMFRSDESTQALAGLLVLAHAPRGRTGAVIGQGSGMTSHYLLGSPALRRLTTIEIEPEVIRASRRFFPANRRVFEDRRSEFVVDDAKSYFAAGRRRYDFIISEPSNPWVSGVAGLFSTEFYRRIRRYLTPDGVFGQWIQIYELNDDLALSVVAAIHQNFRSYEMFMMSGGDLLLVATNRPAGLAPDWSVFGYPGVAADLRHLPAFTPQILEALRVGNRAVLAPLVASGARPNSDFFPLLDQGAEKARYLGQSADGLLHLHVDRFSLTRMAAARRLGPIPSFVVPAPEIPRLRDLAMSAALRSNNLAGIDPALIDSRLPPALERKRRLQDALRSAAPPADWRTWVAEALTAEDDWHLGTTGVVDEGLYYLLHQYMSAARAPQEAVLTVDFMHDMAVWDFARAARESDPLIALSTQGQDWLPPDLLLDQAVAARLLSGDVAGARRAFETLLPRAQRDPRDLRTRLLAAWLAAGGTPAHAGFPTR